jgi:hypothetical protein
MDAAQEDGLWRAVGSLEGDVESLRNRIQAHPFRRPFRIGFGLALGASLGIGAGVIAADHLRDLKKGMFEPIQIEVYPRWSAPRYEPSVEFET